MTGAYEELGGQIVEPKPKREREAHCWKLIARQFEFRKFRCRRCGLVRTLTRRSGDVPAVRYVTRDGKRSERAPPCSAP